MAQESFEKKAKDQLEKSENISEVEYLNYSVMRYLWQANPLNGKKNDSYPKFLREIELLKDLSDNELRILSKSFHVRKFLTNEIIFSQGDVGVGFYFVYRGSVELSHRHTHFQSAAELNHVGKNDHSQKLFDVEKIITLESSDYFGEVALVQENSARLVTAIAREECELLGIFKPDLDRLIHNKPVVAAKFLRALSSSFADKLTVLTMESNKQMKKFQKVEKTLKDAKDALEDLKNIEANHASSR